MDETSSMDGRYSFNTVPRNPVAESTHLNGSSFSWGSVSQKQRSCSSLCLNDTQNVCFSDNSIIKSRCKNFTKIDPRIAADVQSKGLASRIVKYHESGTRLNRSISAHNLYSKPGQFPAVSLKKTYLPYRATRQELSMIRIPPPEKSSFYGNTITSLLRSSSVVGIQSKRSDELSRENRPIIHPPPTENDMAPTRSVLDVLKEISRKRINSEDLESEDTSKKYCNRAGNDFVDNVNKIRANQQNFESSALPCQRYKRQRDCITPHQNVQLRDLKTSPEQAKKRVCNYNNDITSSLSSSLKWKRISKSDNANQAAQTNFEQSNHDHNNSTSVDMRSENLEEKLKDINVKNSATGNPCVLNRNNTRESVPKRTTLEPFFKSDRIIPNSSIQPVPKPRLTLFNKKCDLNEITDRNESTDLDAEATDNLNELNDCAGIPFVKPKKMATKSGLRNPIIERTQKSKLALMLSGLRGELYQNSDEDELDSLACSKEKRAITKDNKNIDTSALKPTDSVTTSNTVTSSSYADQPSTSNALSFSSKTKSTLPSSSNAPVSYRSPLVGLKLSPSKTSSKNISNIMSTDAKETTKAEQKLNVPVLGGFTFCTTNPSSLSVENTSTPSNVLVDIKTTTNPISSISTSIKKTFDLGQSTPSTLFNLDDKSKKSADNLHSTSKNNLIDIPVICTAIPVLATNTSTALITPSSTALSKDFSFGMNERTSLVTSKAVDGSSSFKDAAQTNSVLTFTVPSTSVANTASLSAPILFGTSCSKVTSTKTSVTGTTAVSDNVMSLNNFSSPISTPSFTFNTNKQTSTNDSTSSIAFNLDGNLTSNSAPIFGTNTYSATKPSRTGSNFTFVSAQNLLSVDQTKGEFANQCFSTKTTDGTVANFGNISNSSDNFFNLSNAKSMIDSNKSTALVTSTVLGNSSTPPIFSFGSKSTTATTTTSSNNASSGGFSFSSAASNSGENRTFGFGTKASGQINSLASAPTSQNSFTFGLTSNKPDDSANIFGAAMNKEGENINSLGGFSFGSGTSTKNTTFNFAAVTKSSGSVINSATSPSTGFTFGVPAGTKQNESSIKPFSFGAPQPTNQKQVQSVPSSNGSSLNMFNLSGATKSTQPTAFNFNTGSSTNLQTNAAPANNIFSPTSSNITTGPGDRPIRRATRRLQK